VVPPEPFGEHPHVGEVIPGGDRGEGLGGHAGGAARQAGPRGNSPFMASGPGAALGPWGGTFRRIASGRNPRHNVGEVFSLTVGRNGGLSMKKFFISRLMVSAVAAIGLVIGAGYHAPAKGQQIGTPGMMNARTAAGMGVPGQGSVQMSRPQAGSSAPMNGRTSSSNAQQTGREAARGFYSARGAASMATNTGRFMGQRTSRGTVQMSKQINRPW
jgi:hypothetical protein